MTVAAATAKRAQRNRIAKTGATKALRVLCAEDNPYARVVLKTVLTELGHAVDFAGSGEAAVAAIERGEHDLVLMDVTLAGHGRARGDARDPRARRRGGARADHRHFGTQRAAREGRRARGRHECVSGQAGEPGGARGDDRGARATRYGSAGFASSTMRTTSAMMRLSS